MKVEIEDVLKEIKKMKVICQDIILPSPEFCKRVTFNETLDDVIFKLSIHRWDKDN